MQAKIRLWIAREESENLLKALFDDEISGLLFIVYSTYSS
jgi:hypothetical protein